MTGKELYEIWAPAWDEWSPWVKPVLFTEIQNAYDESAEEYAGADFDLPPDIGFDQATALIVDLPDNYSLIAGFTLAKKGYRPVPMYNTTSGKSHRGTCVLTKIHEIVGMLSVPPPDYVRKTIIGNFPPAFLIDSKRLTGENAPMPGVYDNRWMVFPQDFPSAAFLTGRGIRRVIVIQSEPKPKDDLAHVLLRWQQSGIQLFLQDITQQNELEAIEVQSPSKFRWVMYRALALMGLRKNSAGGFGAVIPIPGQGGGFG
jgi:hypothetical protein